MATDQTNKQPVVPPPQAPPTANSFRMVSTMGVIGLVCGILIVLTFQITLPVITKNKAEALERAVFEVVPGAKEKSTFALVDGTLERFEGEETTAIKFYACYDDYKNLVGVAMEASGSGFQDVLRIIYG